MGRIHPQALGCGVWALVVLTLLGLLSTGVRADSMNDFNSTDHEDEEEKGVRVVELNVAYVEVPLFIMVWVMLVGICKIGFHHAGMLSSIFPESCLLILLGTLVGVTVYFTDSGLLESFVFNPRIFFLFLLPPTVLEASYAIYNNTFTSNIGTILLYAVVGTLLNCFLIAPTLYGLSRVGAMGEELLQMDIIEIFIFASLIVAVDPVAVLAIFHDINVNNVLYFLVFGESLLNDAVTIVLYNTLVAFLDFEDSIPPNQIGLAFASLVVVSLGGILLGTICGLLTAFITKYTSHVRVVEPLTVLSMAYLSYLLAELFEMSGIIAIICCGLMQANYAFGNVSSKSHTTVIYFSKMLATASESIIFMYLGLALVTNHHSWNTGFVFFSILICLLYRALSVVSLTFFANKVERVRQITREEQFIMAFSGLRGAIAFSLAFLLDSETVLFKDMIVTTTLAIIIFTVFIQGTTMKPLVKYLRIKLANTKNNTLVVEMNNNVIEFLMAGIEEICGQKGFYFMRVKLENIDEKYLKPLLQKYPETREYHLMNVFKDIVLKERRHYLENIQKEDFIRKMSASSDLSKHAITTGNHIFMEKTPSENKKIKINKDMTNSDMKKLLVKNPAVMLRRTYDRNMKYEGHQDLAAQLHSRHKRLQHQSSLNSQLRSRQDRAPLHRLFSLQNPPPTDWETQV